MKPRLPGCNLQAAVRGFTCPTPAYTEIIKGAVIVLTVVLDRASTMASERGTSGI